MLDSNVVPFFSHEPHVYLPLSHIPYILARNYDLMVRSIEAEVQRKTARENNGTPHLLCEQSVAVHNEEHFLQWATECRYVYATPVLPGNGFLVLVIRPPARWGGCYEKGPDGQPILDSHGIPKLKQVEALFRLSDMYLLRFQHNNLWWLFKDVKLKGLISGANIHRYMRSSHSSQATGSAVWTWTSQS